MADSRYADDGKVRMSDGSETATVVSNLPGIDEKSVRAYRLERVMAQLVRHDLAGILLFDPEDVEASGYDSVFGENMVVCVESYIGAVGGREGVKLEQPVVITRDGSQPLCTYPFEDQFY